jgi:hypothetical protein
MYQNLTNALFDGGMGLWMHLIGKAIQESLI